MRLKDIRSVNKIVTIPLDDFMSAYYESYVSELLQKYKNNVIAFNIVPKHSHCNVLVKGSRKYFLFKLN